MGVSETSVRVVGLCRKERTTRGVKEGGGRTEVELAFGKRVRKP